jgi:hypothetical protein
MLYVVTLEVVETVVGVGNSTPIRALTTAALTKQHSLCFYAFVRSHFHIVIVFGVGD